MLKFYENQQTDTETSMKLLKEITSVTLTYQPWQGKQ